MSGTRISVERATGPGRNDRRSRFSFWPSRTFEQRAIDQFFLEGLHYIGDWHTHPEDCPHPSKEDVDKIQSIFNASQHELVSMLLVVVGRVADPEGLWCGLVDSSGARRLSACQA
jgi:integrative and conjugative element protein (TIGR02256 family)